MTSPISDTGRCTTNMWHRAAPILTAILEHPFLLRLADGKLDRGRFQFYVVQDALYLGAFARALRLLAAKAPREELVAMFDQHAADALEVEQALHESFCRDLGLGVEAVRSTPMAPTNLAYTSFLLSTAHARPVHEVVAAVLPCYWIYWEVGKKLLEKGSPDPFYRRWIETYAAPEFGKLVEDVLRVTDELAAPLGDPERQAMTRHFLTASRYEWMFWDMAWRLETWPV